MCILFSDYLKEYKDAYERELSQNWLNKLQIDKISIDNIKIVNLKYLKENIEITSLKVGFMGDSIGNIGRVLRIKNENYFVYTLDLVSKGSWDKIKQDESILFKVASFFQNLKSKTTMFFISNIFEISNIEISYIDSLMENLKRGYTFYSESTTELLDKINNSKKIVLKNLNTSYFALLLKARYKWGVPDISRLYVLKYFDPYLMGEIMNISNTIAQIKSIS